MQARKVSDVRAQKSGGARQKTEKTFTIREWGNSSNAFLSKILFPPCSNGMSQSQ
jgi:hypothetical protein